MKHFYSEAAAAPLKVGKQRFQFEKIDVFAGACRGVISIDESHPLYEEFLKVAETYNVVEISEDDLNAMRKKKGERSVLPITPPNLPRHSLKGKAAVVVQGKQHKADEPQVPSNPIQVEQVAPEVVASEATSPEPVESTIPSKVAEAQDTPASGAEKPAVPKRPGRPAAVK